MASKHAASTDPHADLSARFRAIRVGNTSSPQPQPQPQSPLRATTMAAPPAPAPAQQHIHAQQQSSSQPQPPLKPITRDDLLRRLELPGAPPEQYYGAGESSTGAAAGQNYGMGEISTSLGYYPLYASISMYGSHYAKYNALHKAAPKLPPPAAANAGNLNPNTSAIAPPPPPPPPNPSALRPRSSSTLSPSADLFQPAVPMADPNLAAYWDDRDPAVFNPYASAFQSTTFANPPAESGSSWSLVPAAVPRWNSAPTMAQVRSRMLGRPMEPELLASPASAAHVARLLEDGDEQVRRSVLATFRSDVRCFIESGAQRQTVFLALVRACKRRSEELRLSDELQGRPEELRWSDELQHIVCALHKTNGFLSGLVKHTNGLAALIELITSVVLPRHERLLRALIDWLLREPLLYQCPDLVEHCFLTMPYDYSKILIRFAIMHIAELLSSSCGSRSLAHCFVYARGKELDDFEKNTLDCVTMLATGQYGNYFLQQVIEHGGDGLQAAIAQRIAADVVSVSSDQFGSYVVESCLDQARSLVPLRLVLAAFLALGDDDLAGLVRGSFSNYVVNKLLVKANGYMPSQAMELARRIERLPAAVHREMHARGVVAVVRKLHRPQAARLY